MTPNGNQKSYGIIAIMFTIMLFLIAWKLILPGYAANKAQISVLEQQIDQTSAKKDALDKARTELSSIDSAYKAITVSVSDDTDEANIISEIEAIGLKNNIVIPSITISGAEASAAPVDETAIDATVVPGQKISISLSVSSTFDQLNSFVTALEKSVKFMNISTISYSEGEDGQLNLSLGIIAYSRPQAVETTEVTQ